MSSNVSHEWNPSSHPRAHITYGLVWWVSGVTTFFYVLHPYGRHPLAPSACTLQPLYSCSDKL